MTIKLGEQSDTHPRMLEELEMLVALEEQAVLVEQELGLVLVPVLELLV
jgi:hypothetical protein